MIKEYSFNAIGEEHKYRQFPDELENDLKIYFHGTAQANFKNIKEQGFRYKEAGNLTSISFAKNSSLALRCACEARDKESPNGILIMVDISNISPERIGGLGEDVIHLALQFKPKIIGYCIIPHSYKFT